MGAPAIVMGNRIVGTCPTHQIPNPASGAPQPAGPLPFSAPLLQGVVSSVLIHGKAAAVAGSSGVNTPPHMPVLHVSDPFAIPTQQVGRVTKGSDSVYIGGLAAATSQSSATCCASTGSLVPDPLTKVIIG